MQKIINGLADPNTMEELKVGEFEDLKIDEIMENGKSKESWSTKSSSDKSVQSKLIIN